MGEISESFEYGLNAAATEYDGKHKYIRITDIDDSTHLFIQDNLTSPDIDFSTADDYLLQAGDVLFARTGASVGKTYIYRSSDGDLYFAGFLIRAKIKRDYDADFVFQNTLTDNYDSYIRITSQRSGQPGVNAQEYANFALSVPCLAEQKKIGAYFTNLDNLITLHQRECFSFDFSGESAKTAQKTISWEQRKLGECAEFNPKSELPDIFEYVDLESVVGTDILSHRTESKSSAPSRAQRLAQKGDVFYQTVRPYQKNNCIFENDENNWVFSTGYAQLRPVNDGYFLLTLLQNEDFVKLVLDRCTGTSYPAINSNDLADIDVNIPINNLEQQRIGDYFRNLDSLITLHQHKPNKKGHDVLSVMPFKGNQRKPHYLCT